MNQTEDVSELIHLFLIYINLSMKRVFVNLIIFIVTAITVLFINCAALSSERSIESDYRHQSLFSNLTITRADFSEGGINKITVGDIYKYTLTITNHGKQKATEVTLQENFNGWGIKADQIIINHTQGTVSFERGNTTNIAIIHLGELLPKQQAKIDFIVRANGAGKDTIESIVTSKENLLPTRLSTETITQSRKIEPHDLEIIQTADRHHPKVGEIVNIIVYLTNIGTDEAYGIKVHISLPEQLKAIEFEPQYSSYDREKNVWDLAGLPKYTSRFLKISAKIISEEKFSTIAEVISADYGDIDSVANNGANDEDDYSTLTFNQP